MDSETLHPFEQKRFASLVQLARDRFDGTLTQPEARVLLHSAVARDLTEPSNTEFRPLVRADLIRWLLTDPEAADLVDPKGFRIWSVSIADPLDLQFCTISHPVYFLWSTVIAEIALFSAEMKGLLILGSTLGKGLLADGLTVRGPLFIKDTKCDGQIHLVGAAIERNMDLSGTQLNANGVALALDGARIQGSVFMQNGFRSNGEVRMLNARVGGDLGFNGATLTATGKALSLDKVSVEGLVSLAKCFRSDGTEDAFRSDGSVNLPGAQIRGDLNCDGADIATTGISLNLGTAKIGGHIYLRNGFKSRGQVYMHSAEIGNSIDLSGALLTEAISAVVLQEATVRGSITICDGFSSFGRVEALSAHIGGNFICDQSTFAALYCPNMTLKGDLQWTGITDPTSTSLWLNGAAIKSLRDERESWPYPGGLHVDGLMYQELILHSVRTEAHRRNNSLAQEYALNVSDRIEWLQLQPKSDHAEPQPWMQLAGLLRAKGDEDGAKRAIFELRSAKAKSSGKTVRAWRLGFARLQQNPLLIIVPILLISLLATWLFWLASVRGAMVPTSKEAFVAWSTGTRMDAGYPRFNPFVYSLENDLPLVKFGVDDKWAPNQAYKPRDLLVSYEVLRWARVVLILVGWLQATVLAAAISSRFK